ncbi:29491_t:CDS:1, partial [Racocetra persica]
RVPRSILTYSVKNRISKEIKSLKEMKNNNRKELNKLLQHLVIDNTSRAH